MHWLKGTDKTDLGIIPALLVDLEDVQAVLPRFGSAAEEFSLVFPGGNVGSDPDSLNEPASGGGIFAILCSLGKWCFCR